MASLETRPNDYRVVWRQDGKKQFELFGALAGAESFKANCEAQGNRWPVGWIRGVGFAEQPPSIAPTFDEWARRAIAARATANDRSQSDYLRDYENHLRDTFGATPIDRLTREQVGLWLVSIRGTRSAKTIKNIHNLASSIMNDAIDHQLCTANPFRGAMRSLPASKQEEMVFLTRSEFDTLLSKVDEHYRPLVSLLAHTGLRWSEATALRVADVDVLEKRIRVVQAWKRTPENHFVIGEPKSQRSRRTVVISKALAAELVPLVANRTSAEYVFTTVQGRPVMHNNFSGRVWAPAVRAIGRCTEHAAAKDPCGCEGTIAKVPRIHDLRHGHASWLIAAKVALPAIQRRLGHESITTTIDRYGHLVPDIDNEMREALDDMAPEATAVKAGI